MAAIYNNIYRHRERERERETQTEAYAPPYIILMLKGTKPLYFNFNEQIDPDKTGNRQIRSGSRYEIGRPITSV